MLQEQFSTIVLKLFHLEDNSFSPGQKVKSLKKKISYPTGSINGD